MPSETVVLDSGNLSAIIQDATGEPLEPPKEEKQAKPKEEAKEAPVKEEHDGLTEDERKTYSEKMRKSIAWRHGKMKEAQEAAEKERQGRIAAEERAAAAEREAQLLRPKAETAKEPVPADFQTQEAYMSARVKWEVAQELAKDREERRKTDEKAQIDRIRAEASAKIAKALELVPDFAEATEHADIEVPPHIAGYMQESDLFAELGYFFARHPDELDRLAKLRPDRGLVALGKIESTLQPFASAKVQSNGDSTPSKANGASKPSTETDGNPSKPRVTVPVIQPLNTRGAPEVETTESTPKREISEFQRRTGANLGRRQRH